MGQRVHETPWILRHKHMDWTAPHLRFHLGSQLLLPCLLHMPVAEEDPLCLAKHHVDSVGFSRCAVHQEKRWVPAWVPALYLGQATDFTRQHWSKTL